MTLAALMAAVAVTCILLTVATQEWSFIMRRDLEKELIYRGLDITNALTEQQTRSNGLIPAKLEILTKLPNPTLRKVWVDPMTARYDKRGELVEDTGQWNLLRPASRNRGGRNSRNSTQTPSTSGIIGVASMSEELSIGSWNDVPPGSAYTEWRFEIAYTSSTSGQQVTPNANNSNARSALVYDQLRPPGFAGTTRLPGSPPPTRPGSGLPGGRRTR